MRLLATCEASTLLKFMSRCATCYLNTYSCPGHVGHIELPVPVYHATFMDQVLRLLRAKCAYCSHLKLRRVDVDRFVCKLRLLQYGLLEESQEIESSPFGDKQSGDVVAMGADSSGDEDEDPDVLMERRNQFVKQAIRQAGGKKFMREIAGDKVEAAAEERRAVIKEFLGTITVGRECGTCKG